LGKRESPRKRGVEWRGGRGEELRVVARRGEKLGGMGSREACHAESIQD